mgnify:CR=1 FL=1
MSEKYFRTNRRFYITYQKMKEIGPIPRKLWPFYDFFGLDTLPETLKPLRKPLLSPIVNESQRKKSDNFLVWSESIYSITATCWDRCWWRISVHILHFWPLAVNLFLSIQMLKSTLFLWIKMFYNLFLISVVKSSIVVELYTDLTVLTDIDAVFYRTYPLLYQKIGNMIFFSARKLII